MKSYVKIAVILFSMCGSVHAKENANVFKHSAPTAPNQVLAGCDASKSRADLDINNVRCPIWINGDMWWDLAGTALYEIPLGSGKHSLFAGAIWVGGKDLAGQLKVAAQTYRQSGSDFWPGPIDTVNGIISQQRCNYYDKHFKITFAEVKNFHEEYQVNGNLSYPVPDIIKNWPGNGDFSTYNESHFLAPFYDRSGDGIYNYDDGDYPKYDVDRNQIIDPCDKNRLLGDQTIWWVFNDVGNTHGETGSIYPVGVEIQAQAFGFNTNDEVNNMTFYRYKIINRATTILKDTYFGSWVDPDLGNYLDDFVGCDVNRGLGFCYNGDDEDDGALGYGLNPPAIGVDFFEGPIADANDGIDNDRDGIIDEYKLELNPITGLLDTVSDEQIIMSKFVYYNNDFTDIGNPNSAQDYYNYLDGKWKDNSPLVFGGTGYSATGGDSCDFMFPGNSDPQNFGTHGIPAPFEWTETKTDLAGSQNTPSDRRFLQSAGKFTLNPGAVNFITTGVVWARTSSGGPSASVKLLKIADVKAQNLFESCFKVLNGPDAPSLTLRELDKEVIISITNKSTSNNFKEAYKEKDSNIPSDTNAIFIFEGYKVFQVKDPSVSINDLRNADKARLIFQCDIQNGLSQIVNKTLDGDLNAYVPVEEVVGQDKGLRHSFRVTTDAFATGDPVLINHKTYYFMAIAYANDSVADVLDPFDVGAKPGLFGQPYIQSRKNADGAAVPVYTAIPHISTPEAEGLVITSTYGDGPELKRITGIGNGYNYGSDRPTLDLKQEEIESILFNQSNPTNRVLYPTYQRARGPVDLRIYDPLKVPSGEFQLWLSDTTTNGGRWILKNISSGRIDSSERTIEAPYDQLFPDYGFYINLNQVKMPGEYPSGGNGAIEGTITFNNNSNDWLDFIGDRDDFQGFNWILSGNSTDPTKYALIDFKDLDGSQFYEKILGGTWAPYSLVNRTAIGRVAQTDVEFIAPAPFLNGVSTQAQDLDSLRYLGSVDVIITPDKSKWSRCVVFEMGDSTSLTEGGQGKNLLRKHPSMNIDGSYSTDPNDYGRSYFPGYAINVETGERLNIAFGEASDLQNDNGRDMVWNPSERYVNFSNLNSYKLFAGGKHYIYVFGHKNPETPSLTQDTTNYCPAYDGCDWIYSRLVGINAPLSSTLLKNKVKQAWKDCMWVSVPVKAPGQSLLATPVKIRLRVSKPYRYYDTQTQNSPNNNYPFYTFNTSEQSVKVKQLDAAKNALSLINVVPNPYYAYSSYEKNQLDNEVKIVNLPPKCVVSIYSTSGTLIRQFKRDSGSYNNGDYNTAGLEYPKVNQETSIDWNMKNSKGIPIASGVYIIHVKADGIGERTLKWFGVIRPIDLDTF